MKRPGFSLLELCLIISVLALMAYCGMQSFAVYDRLLVHQELDRLYLLFVMLSRKAVVENHTIELALATHNLAHGVQFGVVSALQGPPSTPHAVKDPITFKNKTILFHPQGIIGAGALYLTDSKQRWQYALTAAVGHISYVRRYRYQQTNWELLP